MVEDEKIDARKDEIIEDLPLSITSKFEILLVYLGEKPGCLTMMNSDYYREGEKKLKIGRKLAKENYIEELNIFARKLLLVKK